MEAVGKDYASELISKDAALSCRGLEKEYPDVKAVDNVDLSVHRGERFGILGPNGAGKTTCVEIFEGLTRSDGGVVEVLGHRWGHTDEHALRERLGIQLQETRFIEKLTVYETVRLFRSFYKKGRAVDEVIRTVYLTDKRDSRVGKLSGGQKQRLALACALVGDPELLFLDEPTTGLDPQARVNMWELIDDFHAKGVTILLTTHYMDEAERLCDRVAIMDYGRVIALGTPSELVESLRAEEVITFRADRSLEEAILSGLPGVKEVSSHTGNFRLSVARIAETLPALMSELQRRDLGLESLSTRQANLEDVFISLTGRALRDA